MSAELKPSETSTPPRISEVTGVILAGGKSLRYGRNKALVEVDGVPLIERTLGAMADVFEEVVLITTTPEVYAHLARPMHQDLIKGLGPLGGILTALTAIFPKPGFFVACDMPSLCRPLIRHMAEARTGFDAVVPRIGSHIEALHAIYGPGCLAPIRGLILKGRLQVFQFLGSVNVRYVGESEVRRFDPEIRSFFNINSPREKELFCQSK